MNYMEEYDKTYDEIDALEAENAVDEIKKTIEVKILKVEMLIRKKYNFLKKCFNNEIPPADFESINNNNILLLEIELDCLRELKNACLCLTLKNEYNTLSILYSKVDLEISTCPQNLKEAKVQGEILDDLFKLTPNNNTYIKTLSK